MPARLRPNLDFMPSPVPDRPGLVIRDPFHYSDATLIIPPALVPSLEFFDGERRETDLRACLVQITGDLDVSGLMQHLEETLSTAGFLEDGNYARLRETAEKSFADAPLREPAHAGSGYPNETAELTETFAGYLNGATKGDGRRALAIAAPHVSPFGGVESYRAAYASLFRQAFGERIFEDPPRAFAAAMSALQAFQQEPAEFFPYSSRYDAFLKGDIELTDQEERGVAIFKDPAKGGCAGCHVLKESVRDPVASMFTDYGYEAVAIPRNDRAPRPRKPDLGLCERTDSVTPSDDAASCLYFRTPSLRNVALRRSYMHNGAFRSLREVVAFYATRASDPKRWYKSGVPFDSVPARYRARVNVTSPPYDRKVGDPPALDDREIDAVVAFLGTLTDARYRAAP